MHERIISQKIDTAILFFKRNQQRILSKSLSIMSKQEQQQIIDRTKIYPWHARTSEDCFSELGLGLNLTRTGLSTAEAQKRLEKFGHNKLTEKEKVTLLQRIWTQVANVLVGILVFVAAVSAARAITADVGEDVVTNWIQVGLILFVIT